MNTEKNNSIYLDFMASTPVRHEVVESMKPYWGEIFAHPWSGHTPGRQAAEAVKWARTKVSAALSVRLEEVHFTSGAVEANTWAIQGVVEAYEEQGESVEGKRVALSSIEHDSVASAKGWLEKRGIKVDLLPVNEEGVIDIKYLKEVITGETLLVSVMYVNSEIGTIQPLKQVSKITDAVRKKGGGRFPLLHTDASQAPRFLSTVPQKLGVDLMTLDGHKIYGPKGVGVLYAKKDIALAPLFFDEKRTGELRRGTPPTPLIVGMGEAIRVLEERREEEVEKYRELFDYTLTQVRNEFPEVKVNGSLDSFERIPGNLSLSFPGYNHEFLQVALDERGIALSTASACQSGSLPSRIISQVSQDSKEALRVSFGNTTTKAEIDSLVHILKEVLPLAKEI